jgi:hypothetical protein
VVGIGVPLLLVAVFAGLNLYKSQRALSREKLDAARQRWQVNGVKDYDVTVVTSGSTQGIYRLKVRGGKVVSAIMNESELALNAAQAQPWTVPGLFDALQGYLDWDADPKHGQAYTEVKFDSQKGHLVRYLRMAPGQQRIVIDVELLPR